MTIICVLVKYHGISIKVNTLKRKLSQYRLQGRTQVHSEYTLQEMMQHQFQTFFWISWQKLFDLKLFLSISKKLFVDPIIQSQFLIVFLDLKNFSNHNLNYFWIWKIYWDFLLSLLVESCGRIVISAIV